MMRDGALIVYAGCAGSERVDALTMPAIELARKMSDMLPAAYIPFFTGSMGAAGALIGLLFIAVSIAPERTVGKAAAPERAALAGNAFTALTNVFFISLVALIPQATMGAILIVMGTLSCLATVRLAVNLLMGSGAARRLSAPRIMRRSSLALASLTIYALEIWQGAQIVATGTHGGARFSAVAVLIVTVYGLALVRMWNLLGARNDSILAWFSVLNDLDE
ncbi:MAG TPA: hypothetical protein VF812_02340 [Ktedonobacterales bacterium]